MKLTTAARTQPPTRHRSPRTLAQSQPDSWIDWQGRNQEDSSGHHPDWQQNPVNDATALEINPNDSSRAGSQARSDYPRPIAVVTDSTVDPIVTLNQQVYQRLKLSFSLGLRRQIFVAVCDDLVLRDRLAVQLHADLSPNALAASPSPESTSPTVPRLVSLNLNLSDPNPMAQVQQWLRQATRSQPRQRMLAAPGFQVLGVERLTRQPAAVQRLFLSYLQGIGHSLPEMPSSLLLWLTHPWLRSVQQSAPEFWNWHTGIFEFIGEPTSTTASQILNRADQAKQTTSQPLAGVLTEDLWDVLTQDLAQFDRAQPFASTDPTQPHQAKPAPATQTLPIVEPAQTPTTSSDSATSPQVGNAPPLPQADLEEAQPLEKAQPETDLPQLLPGDLDSSAKPALDAAGAAQLDIDLLANPPLPRTLPSGDRSKPEQPDPGLDPDSNLGLDLPLADLPSDPDPKLLPRPPVGGAPSAPSEPSGDSAALAHSAEQAETETSPVSDPHQPSHPLEAFGRDPRTNAQDRTAQAAVVPRFSVLVSREKALQKVAAATTGSNTQVAQKTEVDRKTAVQPLAPVPLVPLEPVRILKYIEQLQQHQAPIADIAAAYRTLGDFYRDRIEQGDQSPQVLVTAIRSYEQVLALLAQVSPSTASLVSTAPVEAEVLNDLGNLYWISARSQVEPEQIQSHLKRSIQTYERAVQQLQPDRYPQAYAMIQNNLGAAYGDLARYQDAAENLQQSVLAYQKALRYRQADRDRERYAATQNNLGTAYWHLAQYRQPKIYLHQAIAAYQEALEIYSLDQEPLTHAMIQNNLGTAYWNLSQHESPEDLLHQAIAAYQIALKYRTAEAVPAAHAATQNNLGTAYWHLATQVKSDPKTERDHLELAIAAYQVTLDLVEQSGPLPLTFDIYATQNNLGLACHQLAHNKRNGVSDPDRLKLLEAALKHHLKAVQGWQHQPDFQQTALAGMIQTLRTLHEDFGLRGQNLGLSQIPGPLLPQILPRL